MLADPEPTLECTAASFVSSVFKDEDDLTGRCYLDAEALNLAIPQILGQGWTERLVRLPLFPFLFSDRVLPSHLAEELRYLFGNECLRQLGHCHRSHGGC